MSIPRRAALAGIGLGLAAPAFAQGFPTRPITIIAAGAAGGPTDTVTRILADALTRSSGHDFVVESIGGATVGPQRGAMARPDGYTLLCNNIGFAASATLYRRLPYSVLESFAPLGLVSDAAMTLNARPGYPAKDLAEYVGKLKAEGEKLNLAHAGLGSAAHLCGMLLQQAAGAQATTVVFRGTGPAIAELMAGRVDLLCDQATNTLPFIKENRIAAYAVTSPQRVPELPHLPTTAEAGFPSIAMSTWHALYAPAGTPEDIQRALSAMLRGAMRDQKLRQRFAELATAPATEERASIAFHTRFLAEEVARWRPIIQAAGAFAD
ncbi:tripartite tricarboxylate transporter substrate binding protein BugD [Siccirubricoccus sp. KC 17139]|uniref:Tripartite tricarboxylate transporter substrate binding protein BugD n=1 Tax=Siccirubricoccus soli TaxID=2899147 RepID=A0ABT1D224_9PROT|nr:tripartite tricarboxylate transporter substrate-binding protein [Siccirubricoccus soli]MCO6415947.1 tripartite tricarboxylate transporter substrate binding protein BugD [Siccirubricoccus soli]MCP2682079.1 tripartite tricarboxylate transporter substrate-binding protein [Siccirubricoccus soli]